MAAACPKAGTPSCYNVGDDHEKAVLRFAADPFIFAQCGAGGHISKDCSSAPAPKSCYNCGDSGHIVR